MRNASVLKPSKIEGIRSITAPEINFELNIQLMPYDFKESAEKKISGQRKCLNVYRV